MRLPFPNGKRDFFRFPNGKRDFFRFLNGNGPTERPSLVPPTLGPNFLGEYRHGITGYIPPYVRDVPDRFGLSIPRPSVTEEPVDMPPAAMAADWQVPVLPPATQAVPAMDDHYGLATSRPPVTGGPQEVPRVAIPVT